MTDVTTVEQPTPLIVEETNKRDWPAFQIEIMKNLLAEGMSASAIAAALGEPARSRNAVIGKIHRMGLPGPKRYTKEKLVANGTHFRPKYKKPRVSNPIVHWTKHNRPRLPLIEGAEISTEDMDFAIPFEQRKTLFELTNNTCKWPVGHPNEPDFFFCGAHTDHIYCPHHWRRGINR